MRYFPNGTENIYIWRDSPVLKKLLCCNFVMIFVALWVMQTIMLLLQSSNTKCHNVSSGEANDYAIINVCNQIISSGKQCWETMKTYLVQKAIHRLWAHRSHTRPFLLGLLSEPVPSQTDFASVTFIVNRVIFSSFVVGCFILPGEGRVTCLPSGLAWFQISNWLFLGTWRIFVHWNDSIGF